MKESVLLLGLLAATALARASVLWDQSAADLSATAFLDQELPDLPSYSTYQVNDFMTDPGGWAITSVSTYFTRGWGDWAGITQARLNIFPKTGKLPELKYHPKDGTLVDISLTALGADAWEVTASGLSITLSGDSPYWVGLTPVGAYSEFGLEYHLIAASLIGDEAAWRDCGASGGFGWLGVSVLGYGAHDTAFRIEGMIIPEPGALLLLAAATLLCGRRSTRPSAKGAFK